MRFGLVDGQPKTLEEVGAAFGVTRERIRQIETKTLAKLRHPQRSQKLARLPRELLTEPWCGAPSGRGVLADPC